MLSDEEVRKTKERVHLVLIAPLVLVTFTCYVACGYFYALGMWAHYLVTGEEYKAKKKRR